MTNAVSYFTPLATFLLAILSITQTSCALFGGGTPNELNRARDYKVTPPAEWKSLSDSGESDRAFRLRSGSTVTMTSSCNRFADSSLEVLTKQALIGTRNVKIQKRQKLIISGQEGLHSSIQATLDGVPFFLDVIVLSLNKCVYDFQLISPKPVSPAEQSHFVEFAKSLNHGTN